MCPEVSLSGCDHPSSDQHHHSQQSQGFSGVPGFSFVVGGSSGGGGGLLGRASTSSCNNPNAGGLGGGGSGSSLAVAAGSAVLGAATLPTTASVQHPGLPPPRFDEDVKLSLIKVVVLGAPGVGKTSLVKRFVSNDFSSEHVRSTGKSEYFPSLVLNDSLFELKLTDLPAIPFFPADNDAEWREFRFFGLRSASAYLLVYDASRPGTFQYIKTLREQMAESRDMTNVPVIVAANKSDLVAVASAASESAATDKELIRLKKDTANTIRKGWRASHVECSAKFNWNVVAVFRELAVTLDMIAHGQVIGGAQSGAKKRRCLMF